MTTCRIVIRSRSDGSWVGWLRLTVMQGPSHLEHAVAAWICESGHWWRDH